MKKKTKNLVMLCLVFVILLGGYGFVDEWKTKQEAKEQEVEETERIEVTEFEVSDIASYFYENAEYSVGFRLTEDGYLNAEDAAFPTKESTIETQILTIADLEALQLVTGTEKEEYGLTEPQLKVLVVLEDGTERNFYVGDAALFEDAHYVLDVENDVIFLCDSLLYDSFVVEKHELLEMEEMKKPTTEEITFVSIEMDGEAVLAVTYDETLERPWQLTTADGTFDGDTDAVTDWLSVYGSYSVSKAVEYSCNDFSVYGLNPAAIRVTVRYLTTDEAGARSEETLVFEFAADETEDGLYYTRINGSDYVYEVTSYYKTELTEFVLEDLLYIEETDEEETEESFSENIE